MERHGLEEDRCYGRRACLGRYRERPRSILALGGRSGTQLVEIRPGRPGPVDAGLQDVGLAWRAEVRSRS
jgi:hypothetical protein